MVQKGFENIPVEVLIHPTEAVSSLFTINNYLENSNRMVVQIGLWLRRSISIFEMPKPQTAKKAILGLDDRWKEQVQHERKAEKVTIDTSSANVLTLPFMSNAEYDDFLTKNIVFVDLYDSSANNVIVECIVRNTPILINRIPPVVEYLGEDYPFYFSTLEQASQMIDNYELIEKTTNYLSNWTVHKEKMTQEAFRNSILNSKIYQSI